MLFSSLRKDNETVVHEHIAKVLYNPGINPYAFLSDGNRYGPSVRRSPVLVGYGLMAY